MVAFIRLGKFKAEVQADVLSRHHSAVTGCGMSESFEKQMKMWGHTVLQLNLLSPIGVLALHTRTGVRIHTHTCAPEHTQIYVCNARICLCAHTHAFPQC